MSMLKKLTATRYVDQGLLVLRVGLGVMFLFHGWPKLSGGPEKWAKVGGAMSTLGLDFAPAFWGFMAAATEFVGGALLIVGLATRPASFLLVCTMAVATIMHVSKGHEFSKISHPLEDGIAFLALLIMGAGVYSLDHKLFGERDDA